MKNDPVKHCTLYKEAGCSHVDGYLCDFPKCSMYQKHEDHKMKEESPYVPRHIRQHIEQTAWTDDAADALIEMGIYKPEEFHHVCNVVARLMRASDMEIDAAKFIREYIRGVIEE